MAEDISIRGQVRSREGAPIFMIKISVYRDTDLLAHDYTDNDGRYSIQVPAGEPMTVRFDTHPTLMQRIAMAQAWKEREAPPHG